MAAAARPSEPRPLGEGWPTAPELERARRARAGLEPDRVAAAANPAAQAQMIRALSAERRELQTALGLEQRDNALLRARMTWLEHEHHRLELALAAARATQD